MHPLDMFLKKRSLDRARLAEKANVAHSTLTNYVNRSTSVFDLKIWVLVSLVELVQESELNTSMDSVLQELSLYEAKNGFEKALAEAGGYSDDSASN